MTSCAVRLTVSRKAEYPAPDDMKPEKTMNRFRCLAAILVAGVSCLLSGTALADAHDYGHQRTKSTYHYQNMRSPQPDIEREQTHRQGDNNRLERQQEQSQHRQDRAYRDFNRSRNYMDNSRRR